MRTISFTRTKSSQFTKSWSHLPTSQVRILYRSNQLTGQYNFTRYFRSLTGRKEVPAKYTTPWEVLLLSRSLQCVQVIFHKLLGHCSSVVPISKEKACTEFLLSPRWMLIAHLQRAHKRFYQTYGFRSTNSGLPYYIDTCACKKIWRGLSNIYI